jgi:hypothetical protein
MKKFDMDYSGRKTFDVELRFVGFGIVNSIIDPMSNKVEYGLRSNICI